MIQRFKQLRANKMNRPVNEKLLLPGKNCLFLQSILTLLKVKYFISDMIRLLTRRHPEYGTRNWEQR